MRLKNSAKSGKSLAKLAVAALLAGTATGCSSDATRFSGLFSDTDSITTASIPQRRGAGAYGQAPVPRGDLGYGQAQPAPAHYGYAEPVQSAPYNYAEPAPAYPARQADYGSPARAAATPARVERTDLVAPQPLAAPARPIAAEPASLGRRQALAQPYPQRDFAAPVPVWREGPQPRVDSLTTGTTRPASGWSTVNAPTVTLRPGETSGVLAKRYGVPEKEILRANNGVLTPGQAVVIPTFGPARNPARAAAGDIALPQDVPTPARAPEQKLAVLPSPARDKAYAEPPRPAAPPSGGKPLEGTYTVKSGDTLTRIARETGTPIDQLKAANGIADGNIRIGQVLKVGRGLPAVRPAPDVVKTASIPARPIAEKPATKTPEKPVAEKPIAEKQGQPRHPAAEPAAPATARASAAQKAEAPAEKPVVARASVSEVQKADSGEAAPASTRIDKYRWPVNGAVVAGFGQNVNGSRNDGIDISVPEGTPVKAAENGVVIYAGNGLKQLGNTVLVRHDDGKVTVYGHASGLNVSRGQKVTRGQTIATSGMSGDARRPQVHFEVRKDASPVNPTSYLE